MTEFDIHQNSSTIADRKRFIHNQVEDFHVVKQLANQLLKPQWEWESEQ
jgi:hypothetical protein